MTTFVFDVIKVQRDTPTGDILSNIQMAVFAPENSTFTFAYDNPVAGRPFIDPDLEDPSSPNSLEYYTGELSPDTATVPREVNGPSINGDASLLTMLELEWGTSQRTQFILIYDAFTETDYILIAGGDPFPAFATSADFDLWFDNNARGLHPVTAGFSGPFAPGTPFALDDLQGFDFSTEQDFIEDYFGQDLFQTGLDEDTVRPFWGDDIIDLGDEGGDPDFDTVDYAIDAGVQDPNTFAFGVGAINAAMSAGVLIVDDPYGYEDRITGAEQLIGTASDDAVVQDGSVDFFRFRGLAGNDTYVGHSATLDSLDYRRDVNFGGGLGITADFTGPVHTVVDGFGTTDTVSSIDDVRGTAQTDVFYDGDGDSVRWRGEGGDDVFYGGEGGQDRFEGGEGEDLLFYEFLNGGNGIQVIMGQNLIKGGSGRDVIDSIEGIAGTQYRDVFAGTAADDRFVGNGGDDVFRGRGGTDNYDGGAGEDLFIGAGGRDIAYGGADNDIFRLVGGDDLAYGDGGADVMRMGSGADVAYGGEGDDRIFGDGGDDVLVGDAGNDFIEGGNGRDFLEGGEGDDVLRGDGSLDNLHGGNGDDTLYGGDGRDTFQFLLGETGRDTIKDWEDGLDELDLTSFGFTDFDTQVKVLAVNVGAANMRIDLDADTRIVIENFRIEDFDAGDVILTV